MNLPQWLNQEAWSEWVQFRKEIKKKLVPTTINRQLKFLEKHKEDHVLIIEQSIMNGWTGLFILKQQHSFKGDEIEVGSVMWQHEQRQNEIKGEII